MIYILKIMSVLNYQYERGDGGLQESHLMSYRGRVGRPMCPALDVFVPSVDHRVCVCVFVLLWEQNRFFPVLAIEVGGINDKGKVPRTRPATAY